MTYRSRHRCSWNGDTGPCNRGYDGEPKAAAWAVQPMGGGRKARYACFDHLAAVCGSLKQHDELVLHRLSYRKGFERGWGLVNAKQPLGVRIHPENRKRL